MKKIHFSRILLLCTVLFCITLLAGSCKKDSTSPKSYAVTGLWSGTYQNATTPAAAFTMSIKADGTVTHEGMAAGIQHFSSGTWTLSGTTFTCNTTCIYGWSGNVGVKQTYTATFNAANGTLTSGQWANTAPPAAINSGSFILNKVN